MIGILLGVMRHFSYHPQFLRKIWSETPFYSSARPACQLPKAESQSKNPLLGPLAKGQRPKAKSKNPPLGPLAKSQKPKARIFNLQFSIFNLQSNLTPPTAREACEDTDCHRVPHRADLSPSDTHC